MQRSDIMEMAGLGRPFTLGMLYDARHEKLIPGFSLFGDETLQQYVSTDCQRSSNIQIVASDSLKSKSELMDIEASLGLSFLGGLVEVGGSAKYLNNTKKSKNQSRVTLKYKATTEYKRFTAPPGTVKVQETTITEKGLATHVVTGILYGANAFFVFDSDKLEDSNLQDIKGTMEAVIQKIPTISIEGYGSVQLTDEEKTLASNISCKFHGDFILESLPTTFQDAVMTYQKLPELLGEGAEVVPMKVSLVPLKKFYSKADQLVREITAGRGRKIQSTLEELNELMMRCNDAMDDKLVKQFPVIYDRLSNFHQLFQDYIVTIKHTVAEKLPLIRGGVEDESSLEKIIEDREKSPFKNEYINTWLEGIETEITVVKACLSMIEGTQAKFVLNQTELDREVLAPNMRHALCFVFTSMEQNDPYLKVMSNYLESPDSGSTRDVAPSTEDLWCSSTMAILKTKRKAQAFSDLVKGMKKSRNVCFLVTAIENPKYQGATMYHYKEGSLVTTDFTLPRFSPVEDLIDRSDMLWYACDLTFNPNTANKDLALSDNNTFVESGKKQNYPDHPERFDSREQVLCKEGLNGRHYWEVDWTGSVTAGAAYIGMERKGFSSLGRVPNSWGMTYVPGFKYYSMIGHKKTDIYLPYESRSFKRLGMFLDWQAGTLSFYMVSSNVLHHMHTYRHAFTEPVYPGFRLGSDVDDGQVRLL